MTKKRALPPDRIAECVAAHGLFLAKKNQLKLSQKKVAEEAGMTAAAVNLYFKGINPLNAKFAAVLSRLLKEPVERFSPRLAKEIAEMTAVTQAGDQSTTAPQTAEARGTSYSVPAVLRDIAQALNDGSLTAEDGEELRRMAQHLITKNRSQQRVAELPAHLDGIAEAAITTAEQGGNPQDMLKMVEHGLKKSQPKEGPQQDGKRKARSS